MPTIFCFGNEMIAQDSMAKKIGAMLDDVKMCDSPEDMFDPAPEPPLFILDVVEGATEPLLLKISDLSEQKLYSLHDFDLAYFLKLMVQMGTIKEEDVRIIGVPAVGNPKDWLQKVKELIAK